LPRRQNPKDAPPLFGEKRKPATAPFFEALPFLFDEKIRSFLSKKWL